MIKYKNGDIEWEKGYNRVLKYKKSNKIILRDTWNY